MQTQVSPIPTSLLGRTWAPAPTASTQAELYDHIWQSRAKGVQSVMTQAHPQPHSPWLLADMQPAVERLLTAKELQERVMVFGDFDADGVLSTSLLVHALTRLGLRVSYRIPDRTKDSHGLKTYWIDRIAQTQSALVLTCDCGINDVHEVEYAHSLGLDVIITDHHESDPARFPTQAVGVVNPHRADCTYPDTSLAGVGIAFKLVQALVERLVPDDEQEAFLKPYTELVAMGAIADCMPLTGENRILTLAGLSALRQTAWPGLRALFLHGERDISTASAEDVSFFIAPHINAASRLGDVLHAVQLFIGSEANHGQRVAYLADLNKERKRLTDYWTDRAHKAVQPEASCQVLFLPQCPAGICGLVASKISEALYVPTIVVSRRPQGGVGASCRAPDGYHMAEGLRANADLFTHFGGHEGAAGFATKEERVDAIRSALQAFYAQQTVVVPPLPVVSQLSHPDLVSLQALEVLTPFRPFGVGNSAPLLQINAVTVKEAKLIGKERNHLSVTFQMGSQSFRAVAFFRYPWYAHIQVGAAYDVAIELHPNYFRGRTNVSVRLVDLRSASAPEPLEVHASPEYTHE